MKPKDDNHSQDWTPPSVAPSQPPYQHIDESNDDIDEENDVNIVDTQISDDVDNGDDTLLRWSAEEYILEDRGVKWYVFFALFAALLTIFAIFALESITFVILIVIMSVALIYYVSRPPIVIDYILSRKGLHVNSHLHSYDEFKSFGVIKANDGKSYFVLVPRKRFHVSQKVYFPNEIGEKLVDFLASRLPMKEIKLDLVDKILTKLRL